MKFLVAADDSGSLKEIECARGTDTSKQDQPQPTAINTHNATNLQTRIQKLLIIDINETKYIIAARLSGLICVYDFTTYELIHQYEALASTVKDNFVSLAYNFGIIYGCTESGFLSLIDPNEGKFDIEPLHLTLKGPVSAFIPHPEQYGVFAFGGKENDIKIISLFAAEAEKETIFSKDAKDFEIDVIFQGKNVKNDKLDLRVPIWISQILFLAPSSNREDPYHFITITRHGQLRKYDSSHGKKPVSDFKISEKPLLTLSATKNQDEIICSDTHITTSKFDISKGRLLGKFPGAVGSIQALDTFLEAKRGAGSIVTGGLDRYMRVFDIQSREQLAKVYVGTKISALVFLEDDVVVEAPVKGRNKKRRNRKQEEGEDAVEESDEEEIWRQLEEKSEPKSKKRKA